MNEIRAYISSVCHNIKQLIRWLFISCIVGVSVGLFSILFSWCLSFALSFRSSHPSVMYLLPFGGLLIVFLYKRFHCLNSNGTNGIIDSIQTRSDVALRTAPLIFVSTFITILTGGSVGREGAALQIGGSMGNFMGRRFHFNDKDKKIIVMCGMSAAFSALFGTPMAAAIFAMEVSSVGVMYYAALVPCVSAAMIAHGLAEQLGVVSEVFHVINIPTTLIPSLWIGLLSVLCAAVSILFCMALQSADAAYRRFFKNPYTRIFTGGVLIIALTLLVGSTDYLGPGMSVIERAVAGEALPWAFLLKILFTAVTIAAGFKGGEIIPSLFVGATLGCAFGSLVGMPVSLCASIGMAAVFCGVTNCPITSLLISFELFGFHNAPYYLIAIAISYMLSGYYGLYHSQTIVYSKYENTYINRKAL